MKKHLILSSAVAFCLAATLQVSAQPTPITSPNPDFQDTATSSTRLDVGSTATITGTFNLETDSGSVTIGSGFSDVGTIYTDETGFNPLTESIVSGTLNLWLKTTAGDTVDYSVNLLDPTSGSIAGPNNNKVQYDFTDGSLTAGDISLLDNNGTLSYSIGNAGKGNGYTDFTVEDIVLQVATTPVAGGSAPDSCSTALLLGGVAAAFGFIKRKMA